MDTEPLKIALIQATQDFWVSYKRPLLLSNLPPVLSERGVGDYKTILAGKSLKSFLVQLAAQDDVVIVTHPHHPAKVGLIPAGETFAYPLDEQPAAKAKNKPVGESAAVQLLEILSLLDDQDLEKVVIPAAVFAKLHQKP